MVSRFEGDSRLVWWIEGRSGGARGTVAVISWQGASLGSSHAENERLCKAGALNTKKCICWLGGNETL